MLAIALNKLVVLMQWLRPAVRDDPICQRRVGAPVLLEYPCNAFDAEPTRREVGQRVPFDLTSLHQPEAIHACATSSGTSATSPGR
jgi:hypothetical protein